VKVSTGFYSPDGIERYKVAQTLRNLQIAMRADPSFGVFGIGTNAGLNRVFDTAFELSAANAHSQSVQIQVFDWLDGFFRPGWSVAAGH
jgi:hypothetical protein